MKNVVRPTWDSNNHNPMVTEIQSKLTDLANNLRTWSKSTFGSIRGEIRKLMKELDALQNDPARVRPTYAQ